jgi:hypothetical protein
MKRLLKAVERIYGNGKHGLGRVWRWLKKGDRVKRARAAVRWAGRHERWNRAHRRLKRARWWAAKRTIYRRRLKRARKAAGAGKVEWHPYMANGSNPLVIQAVKDEMAIAVVRFGLAVTSLYRATVIPQSNPNSYHGPNVRPGKAGDAAGPMSKMLAYQRDAFIRGRGQANFLEVFGPSNAEWLRNGQVDPEPEGTFLENLHDTHVHVARSA